MVNKHMGKAQLRWESKKMKLKQLTFHLIIKKKEHFLLVVGKVTCSRKSRSGVKGPSYVPDGNVTQRQGIFEAMCSTYEALDNELALNLGSSS